MPVVHIRSLAVDAEAAPATFGIVTRAVAEATPCAVAGVWVTFQPLAAQSLGDEPVSGDGRIAYVDLWLRPRAGDPDAGGRALAAACRGVADGLGLPAEDVWGALHLVEPGAVFAGGSLVE
ncbi:MAG: hypothetical protein U0R50_17480 [Gaiellales bacterium]